MDRADALSILADAAARVRKAEATLAKERGYRNRALVVARDARATQQEMADTAGLTRLTVVRALKRATYGRPLDRMYETLDDHQRD